MAPPTMDTVLRSAECGCVHQILPTSRRMLQAAPLLPKPLSIFSYQNYEHADWLPCSSDSCHWKQAHVYLPVSQHAVLLSSAITLLPVRPVQAPGDPAQHFLSVVSAQAMLTRPLHPCCTGSSLHTSCHLLVKSASPHVLEPQPWGGPLSNPSLDLPES